MSWMCEDHKRQPTNSVQHTSTSHTTQSNRNLVMQHRVLRTSRPPLAVEGLETANPQIHQYWKMVEMFKLQRPVLNSDSRSRAISHTTRHFNPKQPMLARHPPPIHSISFPNCHKMTLSDRFTRRSQHRFPRHFRYQ